MKIDEATYIEKQRQKVIGEYQLLDTGPDEDLDEITKIASELLEVPSCMISIFDKNRQWFKSKYGIELTETPRDVSFSQYAIDSEDVFEIPNTMSDPRFKTNPFAVGDPHVLYYAGMPLINPKGVRFGTLCIIDHTPRRLTNLQKGIMKLLALQITNHLELKKNNELLKKSMEDLVEAEKMKSLGQMANGMAHEINNPLTIIRSKIAQLSLRIERGETQTEEQQNKFLRDLDASAFRIEKIIKSLVYFSKGLKPDLAQSLTSQQVIDASLPYLKYHLHNIDFTILDKTDGKTFKGNKEQIVQVLLNLLNNSIDAMSETPEKKLLFESYIEGDNFIINIRDTGSGIDKKDQNKIMDPFFTTKEVGKGMGLGLSLSLGIIVNHGGTIHLLESGSRGTSFQITLPIEKKSLS
jgi:signal transduction histidine kinase